jgi:hypothetical protein
MPSNVRTALHDAAARPARPLDLERAFRRGHRLGLRRRAVMAVVALGLVAATAVLVPRVSELVSRDAPTRPPIAVAVPADDLVVGSIEEKNQGGVVEVGLRAIDLETGDSRLLEVSDFLPGDAQFSVVRTGSGYVYRCESGACALEGNLQSETHSLGEAWCLSPSATEGRVWLAYLDPNSPSTVRSMEAIQEVFLDGEIATDSQLPPDRWHCPVGAVNQGVLFSEGDDIVVWDTEAGEVVSRLPGPFPADAQGDLVAWCDFGCRGGLHVTDIRTGEDVTIESDGDFRLAETFDGAFSPDGSLLALPVTTGDAQLPNQVALVDVEQRTARLIEGLRSRGPMDWASTGERLFVVTGAGRITVYDAASGDLREVAIDAPEIFEMAAR